MPISFLKSRLNKFPSLKQFIKFCLVGGTSAAIHFSILFTFTEWLKFWYLISSVIGFLVSATFNFSANKFWTFRNYGNGREAFNQFLRYAIVIVSGLIINTLIIYILTDFAGFDYRLSWVFATGAVTFWNFGFNRLWTFRAKSTEVSQLLTVDR
ncbi:MAG: hypothetical protein A3J65_04360 [Candidatus Buchananbacteria bacterium RIFCSPHIGHO2_02_FULL_45_11b]|uniref:GtrA/DPMS transmembrane domain-containing protein n=1 Tax=Candidatus Buchananbacteria bacterium RIFCSPHIGHO2_02_FULL_45_11b TaxID=1797541 RepID=A0A1G1YD03_9BACT|nr:MAG: hypothetical protein A3J65_04360 [Candidatus Buchananbacteria bacterium RIFCSPHIGHO2_02_FULL_45_11b]